jgi:hypothetical protein
LERDLPMVACGLHAPPLADFQPPHYGTVLLLLQLFFYVTWVLVFFSRKLLLLNLYWLLS